MAIKSHANVVCVAAVIANGKETFPSAVIRQMHAALLTATTATARHEHIHDTTHLHTHHHQKNGNISLY